MTTIGFTRLDRRQVRKPGVPANFYPSNRRLRRSPGRTRQGGSVAGLLALVAKPLLKAAIKPAISFGIRQVKTLISKKKKKRTKKRRTQSQIRRVRNRGQIMRKRIGARKRARKLSAKRRTKRRR